MKPNLAAKAALLPALLTLSACGTDGPAASDGSSGGPVEVHYSIHLSAEEQAEFDRAAEEGGEVAIFTHTLFADGPNKLRLTTTHTYPEYESEGEAAGLSMDYTYDGASILMHDPENEHPYMLVESADGNSDSWYIRAFALDEAGRVYPAACPGARKLAQTKTILGRTAIGFRCTPPDRNSEEHFGWTFDGDTWFDQQSGVFLENGQLVADTFDADPDTGESTFAMQPPDGSQAWVVPTGLEPGEDASETGDIALERIDANAADTGGSLTFSDLEGEPYVLAIFMSDLYFDANGDVCPGCVDSMLALQELTNGGTSPLVVGVQSGEMGKPGLPLIPEGLDIMVVNDPEWTLMQTYGVEDFLGFAFVDSQGAVQQVLMGAATKSQLKEALVSLS